MEIRPLSPVIGAEILGVDLGASLSNAQVDTIARAHADHGVIFFRDQRLTPEQHIAFARRFGDINVNRFFKPVPGYPLIAEVRKEPEQHTNIGGMWHTDHSYDTAPAMGSILYALEVPDTGGDTLFASMYRAWETLSDGMKGLLSGLKAAHSSRHVFGDSRRVRDPDIGDRLGNAERATQDAIHPVVITHPVTGRHALYVNPQFAVRFDGWTEEESRPLLEYLYRHASRPKGDGRSGRGWRRRSFCCFREAVAAGSRSEEHGNRRIHR